MCHITDSVCWHSAPLAPSSSTTELRFQWEWHRTSKKMRNKVKYAQLAISSIVFSEPLFFLLLTISMTAPAENRRRIRAAMATSNRDCCTSLEMESLKNCMIKYEVEGKKG